MPSTATHGDYCRRKLHLLIFYHNYLFPSRGTSAALHEDSASSRVTPKLRRTSAALPGGPSLRDGPCEAESEGIPLPYSTPRHLLQYVTWRANANGMMKLQRFTKRLRYRCGLCFANFNRPFQTRRDRTSLRPKATPATSMETRLPAASLPDCAAAGMPCESAYQRTYGLACRRVAARAAHLLALHVREQLAPAGRADSVGMGPPYSWSHRPLRLLR